MRSLSLTILVIAVALVPVSLGVAVMDHNRHRTDLERRLSGQADQKAGSLDAYFLRARSENLLLAHENAFSAFYTDLHGPRMQRIRPGSPVIEQVNRALAYLERLYPGSIGEACFIDRSGPENARIVRGKRAAVKDLSPDESGNPFFGPTFALPHGAVYQAKPYVSPDMHEWVISNSTLVPTSDDSKPAIVHFEVRLESFRQAAARAEKGVGITVLDADTGAVVIDGSHPLVGKAPLGDARDHRFRSLAGQRTVAGVTSIGGHVAAYRRVSGGRYNANHWIVVAMASGKLGGPLSDIGPASVAMLALAAVMMAFALLSLRATRRALESAALTDVLTGLANRRALVADLERRVARAASEPSLLMLFDLNGFKTYNDTFGHLAGDALLTRLGGALEQALSGLGRAYRLGGDEFCVLAGQTRSEEVELAAIGALSERGEGFQISASFGTVAIPAEARDATEALRIADQRMYAQKAGGRAPAERQTSDALLRALSERHPEIEEHLNSVAELTRSIASDLGLEGEELDRVVRAAQLHDIGKVGIPEAILSKAGELTEDEWAFVRRHTLIGERIVAAAPALASVAKLVRSTHERWDGRGYPDGLAGEEIPLGARIVAVCDAFDAITSDRPYRARRNAEEAVAELQRCAGSQFDAAVVSAFTEVLARHAARPLA